MDGMNELFIERDVFMYNAAMDKIRDEMANKASNPGVQEVGRYITDRLQREPGIARELNAEGKTLEGAYNAIYAYASKHRTGNFAFVPPDVAFALIDDYFGISVIDGNRGYVNPFSQEGDVNLDLDALLED